MNASTGYVLTQMLRGVVAASYSAKDASIPEYAAICDDLGYVAFDVTSMRNPVYGIGGFRCLV